MMPMAETSSWGDLYFSSEDVATKLLAMMKGRSREVEKSQLACVSTERYAFDPINFRLPCILMIVPVLSGIAAIAAF